MIVFWSNTKNFFNKSKIAFKLKIGLQGINKSFNNNYFKKLGTI